MHFHIYKRTVNPGRPYEGYECADAGVDPGKVYSSLEKANEDASILSQVNPVGFSVGFYPWKRDATWVAALKKDVKTPIPEAWQNIIISRYMVRSEMFTAKILRFRANSDVAFAIMRNYRSFLDLEELTHSSPEN